MYIKRIIIPAYVLDKLSWKHHVFEEEIYEILFSRPKLYFVEKGDVAGEDIYLALGQTESGRYLSVFFIYKKDGIALILSARDMSKKKGGYMAKNKKTNSIPDHFKDVEEASDFWDSHDAGEYEEYLRPVSEELRITSKLPQAVLLEHSLSAKLKEIACQRGVSLETLVNLWLSERL